MSIAVFFVESYPVKAAPDRFHRIIFLRISLPEYSWYAAQLFIPPILFIFGFFIELPHLCIRINAKNTYHIQAKQNSAKKTEK
jgi:hypothetical protein